MSFEPTEDQAELRREIVRFARAQLNEGAMERDRDGVFPRELWRACGGMGLTGLPVPPELGGQGADPLTTAMALEAFGYGCTDGGLVFSVCAHLLACVVPVMLHVSFQEIGRNRPLRPASKESAWCRPRPGGCT